eukprot:m.29673 g.29673  ORF g.29673 m.29673 type:complete len:53 (+) comp6722_c0_seq1:666-824(+)
MSIEVSSTSSIRLIEIARSEIINVDNDVLSTFFAKCSTQVNCYSNRGQYTLY